jgi:hypothetical protein
MPSQLLRLLADFYDEDPARRLMAASAHWQQGVGAQMNTVQTIMIHETSGWPSFASAGNFIQRFTSAASDHPGIGPQFFMDPNATAFRLIDISPNRLLTNHASFLNHMSIGIENGDAGDANLGFPANHLWTRLPKDAAHPANDDFSGRTLFLLLHQFNDEDAVLLWFANLHTNAPTATHANYTGPGDIDNVGNFLGMLFCDRHYDHLACLCRYLAEELGIPRNFPLLPWQDRQSNENDVTVIRKLLLADPRADMLARAVGKNSAADFQNLTPPLQVWYLGQLMQHRVPADHTRGKIHNVAWSNFFEDFNVHPPAVRPAQGTRGFCGFIAHSLPGAIGITPTGADQSDHPCPGPYFDWHRFSRQVWDWWWYPFDFDQPPALNIFRRAYAQARRNTPLIEYFFDAVGHPADYNGLHQLLSQQEQFRLPDLTPVYALANGIMVAARIPLATTHDPSTTGFVLTRHRVFWQLNGNRINYDLPPTYVWTLISFLEMANASFTTISDQNPDWLNRIIVRATECELADSFHQQHPSAALERGWNHQPIARGARLATGQEIEWDAVAMRGYLTDLAAGRHVLLGLETDTTPTPITIILGDLIGFPNELSAAVRGIQVEIFSRDPLNVPGARVGLSPWEGQQWWRDVCGPLRHEQDAAQDLHIGDNLHFYPTTDFLAWINDITWTSEWDKFAVVDAAGQPVLRPNRPPTRINL